MPCEPKTKASFTDSPNGLICVKKNALIGSGESPVLKRVGAKCCKETITTKPGHKYRHK